MLTGDSEESGERMVGAVGSTGGQSSLRRLSRRQRRAAIGGLILGVVAALVLGLLVALPFTSSYIESIPSDEAQRAPSPDFRLGPLEWDVSRLAVSRAVEPFRRQFRSSCGNRSGSGAAVCVSDAMARAFANGDPSTEFVDPGFEPVTHLRAHLAGRPGHCMNRSAILAAELLASGVPARVVQVFDSGLAGHTLVETWTEEERWQLFDPSFGRVLRSGGRAASALDLVSGKTPVEWVEVGKRPSGVTTRRPPEAWTGGTVVYPEPWLYLRIGRGSAPWPYRGRYVALMPASPAIGLRQRLLTLVLLVASLGCAGCFTYAVFSIRRRAGTPERSD